MSYRYYGPRDHKPTIREVLFPDGTRPKEICIDTETISLANRTPIGLAVAATPEEAVYFPLWPETDNPDVPWDLISDPDINRIYHNASFDLDVLRDWEPNPNNITCTLVMAHLLSLPGVMEQLIWFAAPHWKHVSKVRSAKAVMEEHHASTMLDLSEDVVAVKCCIDVMATLTIYHGLVDQVDPDYLAVEMSLFPIFIKMGRRGIAIDEDMRQAFEAGLEEEVAYFRGLAEAEGFNPGSPQQVGFILAKRGTWLPMTRGHKSLKTDKKILEKLEDPIAGMVLLYRYYQKMLGTYIRPLDKQERSYTRFHLDAVTGRPSSTERNHQNVPPLIRPIFVPDNGVFTSFDFSQIELRVLAHLSGDKEMLRIFDEYDYGDGQGIHQETADFMGCLYKTAKNAGFAMIYGGTEETVMDTAKTSDRELVRRYIRGWSRKYPEAWDWIQGQQEDGLRGGRVRTVLGREFVLPVGEKNDNFIRRISVNYPIQGSASEVFKRALIKCLDMELANQVHDEIIVDGMVEPPGGLDSIIPGLHTPIQVTRMQRWE